MLAFHNSPNHQFLRRIWLNINVLFLSLVAVPASGPNRTIEGLKTIVTTNQLVLNALTTQTVSVGDLRDENGAVFSLDTIMSSIVRSAHGP